MEGILIREMRECDISRVYEILNLKYVLKYSCKEEIEDQRVAYFNWYQSMINSDNFLVFVVTNLDSEIIGSIIYEIKGKKAIINLYLSEETRGKGYSYFVIENTLEILKEKKRVKKVVAYILKENSISIKSFERLGFIYKGNANYKGLRHLYYSRDL